MTTLTMEHPATSGAASSTKRPTTRPSTRNTTGMREHSAGPSASHAMIYVVSGPQTKRGAPDPVVGVHIVHAALWVMFAAAIINTLAF